MPRPLVFGNGSLLVGYDSVYAIRDLMYPQVGLYNHLNDSRIRMGVWVDRHFGWCDEDGWDRQLGYVAGTMVGQSVLTNAHLGIRLSIREAVTVQDAHLRAVSIENLTQESREVRLFFTQDLHIRESDIGDTAFYHPGMDGVVHFKQSFYFLFGGAAGDSGVFEYACGINGFGGLRGTWIDAEDGHLGMNAIAQGSVDSTFSLRLELDGLETREATYWMVAASSLGQLEKSFREVSTASVASSLNKTESTWRETVSQVGKDLQVLPRELIQMAESSLVVLASQVDSDGAIIASTDSDIMKTNRANYSYTWPRDGAFVSMVAAKAGLPSIARRFLEFCSRASNPDQPILAHKYMADGTIGATWHPWIYNGKSDIPFQEDETASTLVALLDYFEASEDLEFLSVLYSGFAKRAGDFMLRHRDPATKLPLASYDLWEERRGVHTYTTAMVISGLRAVTKISQLVGEREGRWAEAAEEMTAALQQHLFDDAKGVFYRRLFDDSGHWEPDRTVDASVLHVGLEAVLPPDHPMVLSTEKVVEETLWVRSAIGGLARYEGDYYFRLSDDYPGNPWIICTMWLAQHKLLRAASAADLERPRELLEWARARCASTGVLPEQVHPDTGEHLSVSPLTWSHAEVIKTCYDLAGRIPR